MSVLMHCDSVLEDDTRRSLRSQKFKAFTDIVVNVNFELGHYRLHFILNYLRMIASLGADAFYYSQVEQL